VTVIGFNIWCSVPSFIKIGRFFTEIWRFNDFQNGGRPPSWILKICSFLSCSPCRYAVLLPHTKFRWNRTIGRWIIADILNFKNFNFWSRDSSGSLSDVVYQILSKSDDFSLRYGDLAIFKWRPSAILDLLWRHNTASPDTFSLYKYCAEISCWSVL